MIKRITTRQSSINPKIVAKEHFKEYIENSDVICSSFLDSKFENVIVVENLPKKVPIINELYRFPEIRYLFDSNKSYLIKYKDEGKNVFFFIKQNGNIKESELKNEQKEILLSLYQNVIHWGGDLNEKGEHIIDLTSPTPGPHYNINLLLGNRMKYPYPLQSTPKSVVDHLGRGSFRSHAASQVLATRWDMLPEENGFPANRQFYLLENEEIIFFSADPLNKNILEAKCIHSINHTKIYYKTKCGLEIERVIFILPQEDNLPLATEVQQIKIKNNSENKRDLKIIYIGMFGTAAIHAIFEDVIYSNVIMQSQILQREDGSMLTIGWDYHPEEFRVDHRFHSMILHQGNDKLYPNEFCFNYSDFVGTGNLNVPQNILKLNNKMQQKGPGFFALGINFSLNENAIISVDNLTGISSKILNKNYDYEKTYREEIVKLVTRFNDPKSSDNILNEIILFQEKYNNYIQIESNDKDFKTYFNRNLPFQILYQTFLSRSFSQTQKAYREIGFREIQDLFASMYNIISISKKDLVKTLLKTWASNVYEFGYANHNFYWVGKEPGKFSDDALWFVQALDRYIGVTNDYSLLTEECEIAGSDPVNVRTIFDTIVAIIKYSSKISIGKHGLPLVDLADWNDCLKVDEDAINGPTKEKLYYEQIEKSGNLNEPFISNYSESVMNAFLLKIALDIASKFANHLDKEKQSEQWKKSSADLTERIQKYAWKDDFFARVLFNKYPDGKYTYIGAKGDGLSADPHKEGSYFLNSFSWSIFANIATEQEINTMLDTIEKNLTTPFGVKIISPTALEKVSSSAASSHYFPGDRENGGIFKHACMFFVSALFKAAKEVESNELAQKMTKIAYWMIDLTLPYKTIENPYVLRGNPRICTQYINSETGENVGPLLSGTATWLYLSLISALGIEYSEKKIIINPIIREEESELVYRVNTGRCTYSVKIIKPIGFFRIKNSKVKIFFDDKETSDFKFPLLDDGGNHSIKIIFNN